MSSKVVMALSKAFDINPNFDYYLQALSRKDTTRQDMLQGWPNHVYR